MHRPKDEAHQPIILYRVHRSDVDGCSHMHHQPLSDSNRNNQDRDLTKQVDLFTDNMADDDCWDAFGSDDDEEEQEDAMEQNGNQAKEESIAAAVALYISRFFLQTNSEIRLSDRVVRVLETSTAIQSALKLRGISVVVGNDQPKSLLDATVVLDTSSEVLSTTLVEKLVPGGLIVTSSNRLPSLPTGNSVVLSQPDPVIQTDTVSVNAHTKQLVQVHRSACPWLPGSHSVSEEEQRLESATVLPSAFESSRGVLSTASATKAVRIMNDCGYCIIRKLLNPEDCTEWGQTVLASVSEAAKILLERDEVDIYHPHTSKSEPQSYRELSMREDLRLDLRGGPQLSDLRSRKGGGNEPIVITSETESLDHFLRGNKSILEVIRRVMNPVQDDLYKGNLGRFNFGGRGADGSFQDLRLSQIGGIVSLPGSADQAMHADTPHLFEHMPDLPAHYINVFAPGTPFDEEVGGTAFVHGSHRLDFTAKHCGSSDNYKAVYPYLVRPRLDLGDVVLFDCRVLHFGMANRSKTVERVMLYTNTTQAWFHDPKNWDQRRPIF